MHVCERRKEKYKPGTESQELENKTEFAFLKVKRQSLPLKTWRGDSRMLREIFLQGVDSDFQDLEGRFKNAERNFHVWNLKEGVEK